MIWTATAELKIGAITLDQSLTTEAADFAAAVALATRTFDRGERITGVTLTRCPAVSDVWGVCDAHATATDGYCDDCRDAGLALTEDNS